METFKGIKDALEADLVKIEKNVSAALAGESTHVRPPWPLH